jgi:hypothetical protein
MEKLELEQHIVDVLTAKGVSADKIEEYIDEILAFSDIDDYQGITDEAICSDYDDWAE